MTSRGQTNEDWQYNNKLTVRCRNYLERLRLGLVDLGLTDIEYDTISDILADQDKDEEEVEIG